ncbi:MAG: phosphotransferase family protein [Nocardioides sp.]|uniref:phosphotransferase family protein n=1 Tax=Nocardioides sp. TaxID=35761 RepID=UPI003D6C49A2
MRTDPGMDCSAALEWVEEMLGEPTRDVRPLVGGATGEMLALRTESGNEAVLRLTTNEPWRTHGATLNGREAEIQEMLAGSGVPAPRSLALDRHGERCEHPAHLMTLLPGQVDQLRTDPDSLGLLAQLLADIHAIEPTIHVRDYQSWAWEEKFVIPDWAADRGLWDDAFALLSTAPPAYEPCFIHRDFALRNVLWADSEISGIVDWVETSIGPAWLDVAHCSSNIAVRQGCVPADAFADAYVARTGRESQPYFDVMDLVGFLPPPGRPPIWSDPAMLVRLEERLAAVLPRCK